MHYQDPVIFDQFCYQPVLNTNSQSTTTSLEKYTAPTFLLPAITPLRLLSTIINEIGSSNRKVCEASPVFVELQQNIIKMHTSVAIEAHSFVPNETSFQVTGSIQKVLSARTPGLSSVSSPRTILVKKDNVIDGDGQQYNVVRHYQTFVCIDRMVKTLKAVHIMLHGASPTTWSHPSGFPRARLFQENFGMKKAQEVRSDRVAFSTRIKQRLRKPVGFMHTQVYCPSYESAEKGRCGAFALHGTSLNEKPRCRWLEQREAQVALVNLRNLWCQATSLNIKGRMYQDMVRPCIAHAVIVCRRLLFSMPNSVWRKQKDGQSWRK
ncbi:hypothetical protein T265_14603, partial [Opisthorchis viverrini]